MAHRAPLRNVATRAIQSVTLDRRTLNVAARDVMTIVVDFAQRGTASVLIVDRDGFPVRTLAKSQLVAGKVSFGWDGRDDRGEVVADEAYSLRIDWKGGNKSDVYFPADAPAKMQRVEASSYSRRSATLAYTLAEPSRVHIQAGTAALDPKTKQLVGPVMKTVVNREPRGTGAIAEHWSGFDESGTVFIPDLKDFVVAIAATPLPENSIITFGNAQRRFVETITTRRGASLFTHRGHADHHAGLSTLDDVSPALTIQPLNAIWSPEGRVWIVRGSALRARLALEGPSSAAFRRHPATIERFVDGRRLGDPARKRGDIVEIPLDARGETQRISVNWNSDFGPVAANTIQVRR
jgi:hypothetical protein